MLDDKTNKQIAKRVEQTLKAKSEEVTSEPQTDAEFIANLHDLCVLNKMAESHTPEQDSVTKKES